MKLSKQRMAYGAVLGLGLVALIADRALMGPSSASAAAVSLSELGPIPTEKPAAAGAAGRKGPALCERLGALAIEPPERDGFTPPKSWVPVAAAASEGEGATAKFASSNKLTSIVSLTVKGEKRPVAIVNGKPLSVGEKLGDFTLSELTVDSATFRGEAGAVTLRLPEPERGDVKLRVHGREEEPEPSGGQERSGAGENR